MESYKYFQTIKLLVKLYICTMYMLHVRILAKESFKYFQPIKLLEMLYVTYLQSLIRNWTNSFQPIKSMEMLYIHCI